MTEEEICAALLYARDSVAGEQVFAEQGTINEGGSSRRNRRILSVLAWQSKEMRGCFSVITDDTVRMGKML